MSATHAPFLTSPSPSYAGVHASAGTFRIASRMSWVTAKPTE